MSESSIDKSKRLFSEYLEDCVWKTQISVFYQSMNSRPRAITDKPIVTEFVRRQNPDAAILYRLASRYIREYQIDDFAGPRLREPMRFHTMFLNTACSQASLDKLEKSLNKKLGVDVEVLGKSITYSKALSYAKAVRTQAPHDLKALFGDDRVIRRWALIGQKNLRCTDSAMKEWLASQST